MTSLGLLAVFWAAAQQLPIATQAQLPTGETAELAAEQLLYEPSTELLTLRGNTLLKMEGLTLRADELTYDQKAQTATARGKVMLVAQGTVVAVADQITVDIKSMEATVQGGLFMQKRGVTEAQLLAAKTPEELKKLGENLVTLSGERIRKSGDDTYVVDGISFTPCDCKPSEPSWRVEADRAEVEVGEAAVLTWPKMYVYDVPILALPWLYLPLAERRTGLLVTVPEASSLNGFSVEQPIFITLGESYDLTLTPGYFFGSSPDDEGNNRAFGIAGPRLHTEFRYTPTEAMKGRITLAAIYDLRTGRNPFSAGQRHGLVGQRQAGGDIRGLRGEASLQHTHDMGNGWSNRADMSFVSDGFYTRDFQADILRREVPYLRSTAVLFHRGEDHYVGLDLTLRQDLRYGLKVFERDYLTEQIRNDANEVVEYRRTDTETFGPNTFHRLPGLTFGIPERPLWGPVFGSFNAEFVRISPLLQNFGDEGEDGFFEAPSNQRLIDAAALDGQGNGQYDLGEREGRLRLDLHPELAAELRAGDWLRGRPYVSWRQDVYLGERTGGLVQRGYPMLGTEVSTELSRTFGDKVRLRHSISPVAEVRFVPFVSGETLGTYDEIDTAVNTLRTGAQPGFLHGKVEVQQRFATKTTGKAKELLRLDLGVPFDLGYRSERRLGDLYARSRLNLDRIDLQGMVRYSVEESRITQIAATGSIRDGKGNSAYARYDNLAVDGGDRLRRGIDTLVGPPSLVRSPLKRSERATRAQMIVAGGRYQFPFGIHARYEASITPDFEYANPPRKERVDESPSPLATQVVGVSYGPACDCWRLEGYAVFRRDQAPDFGVNVTLARFGSFGTGR